MMTVDSRIERRAPAGEMAERIRRHDWSATALGDMDAWPQSLRTAVDMILGMPTPANILWGGAHLQIYNDGYIDIARDRHPGLLGRPAAEGWPEAFAEVLAPLIEAVFDGRSVRLAKSRVALRGPDGEFEERVFETNWSPIRDESGAVAGALEILVEVTDRYRAEAARRESEERYRAILESALDYAIFTMDPDGLIETWSPGAEAVFGWTAEEAIGRPASITFLPEDRESGAPDRERAEARAKGFAPNVRWHLRKDGHRVFIEGSCRPMRDGGSGPISYLKVGQDVTERRHWEERQKVLLAELQHRTRNLILVVQSMFDRTRRGSNGIEELAGTYKARLGALARVQGLLSRLNESERITFDDLLRTELSAMGAIEGDGGGERVVLDGPAGVRLRSSTVQTFALALHELATNAAKYGALMQPDGRLTVRWRMVDSAAAPRLRVEWTESGLHIPEAESGARRLGYGRELIERALPYQLQAETTYRLGSDGVRCTIELPVSGPFEPPPPR